MGEVVPGVPRGTSSQAGLEDTWGESVPNAWLLDRQGLTPE